ncbi:iron ABC transporter substrate-binding protein [Xanthomonadaceae bacterium JHOS43]|nr:iron ABC transporter substrate-binding protein [Xanthomonadaceae bacterium JHOS43]
MKRRDLLQTLAWTPLLAAGASRADTGASAAGSLVTAFGTLPGPTRITRVFATGAPAGVLVYVLAPDKLLGWPSQLDDVARRLLPNVAADLPHLGRLSGRGSTVTTEALLALRPDLVLDAGTVDPTHRSGAERVWRQTGLPYALIDGRLADTPAQLRETARLLGAAKRGEQLANEAQRLLDLTHEVLAGISDAERPRVYYGRGPDGLETGLQDSINMEAIELAGARNVAAQAGRGGLTQVSMEQILAWNPEVVLTQSPEFAWHVHRDPLWRNVAAARQRRVHLAPRFPFGWLDGPPGINRILGLPWLLSKLHPGRHPALAPTTTRDTLDALHRLFYGSALPDGVLDDPANEAA